MAICLCLVAVSSPAMRAEGLIGLHNNPAVNRIVEFTGYIRVSQMA